MSNNDLNKKKWSELDKPDRDDIELKVEKLVQGKKQISNQYNFKIYDWFFLLNAGGLIGAITLLTIRTRDPDYIILCAVMAILFSIGTAFIVWANLTERYRFKTRSEQIEKNYNKFKEDKITKETLDELINADTYDVQNTKIIESISMIAFVIGIIIGAVYLFINSQSMCEPYEKCQKDKTCQNPTPVSISINILEKTSKQEEEKISK